MSKTSRIPIYKVMLVREAGLSASEAEITNPKIAASIARDYLDGCDREHFIVLLLDSRNRVRVPGHRDHPFRSNVNAGSGRS